MPIQILDLPAADCDDGVAYLRQYSVSETYPLHGHNFYEFFFIPKGQCIHEINQTRQLLKEGSLVFIRPQDNHRFSFFNEFDMEIISIGVLPELIHRACEYYGFSEYTLSSPALPPYTVLEGVDFDNINRKLTLIGEKKGTPACHNYIISLLPELFFLFFETTPSPPTELPEWLYVLLDQMRRTEHFTEGLSAMLRLSHVSQEYLNRSFRKYLNMTPTEYINARRINYACSLLLTRRYKLLDICYMSGFNNPTLFYRCFHRQYHCTPKEFLARF